jgi:hypothetical protein
MRGKDSRFPEEGLAVGQVLDWGLVRSSIFAHLASSFSCISKSLNQQVRVLEGTIMYSS